MTFLIDNILFIVLALVSGGMLLWPKLAKGGGSAALGTLEATQLINHRNAIVVDLRDEKDFAAGSLAGARHVPYAQLAERVADLARFKSRPVLIVCSAGQQSARAIATFKEAGFTEAYALAGGIGAWSKAALPLVQPGRDNTRPAVKEPSRKSKNEQRARAARNAATLAVPADATVVDPAGAIAHAVVPAAEAAEVAAATDEPSRVKEPS